LPPTVINPEVIQVFEDWILKGWGSTECRNRYCVFSCPHLHHERERERESERATVCVLHDAGVIALGIGVSLVDELLDLHHLV